MKIEFLDDELTEARITVTEGMWWWKRTKFTIVVRLDSLMSYPVHTYWKYKSSERPVATDIHQQLEKERARVASRADDDWQEVSELPRAQIERR